MVKLEAEEREAAERAAARALADSLDSKAFLQLMVGLATRILDANYARIWLLENDVLHAAATTGDVNVDVESRLPYLPLDSAAGQALLGPVVNLGDVSKHPSWRDAAFVRRTGLAAYLCAALAGEGKPLGAIEVMRPANKPFSLDDEQALRGIARFASATLRTAQPAEAGLTRSGGPGVESLTPRERQVLRLIAQGRSNAEAAHLLQLSTGTVKLHVKHVLAKLGVTSRTQAAARAFQLGLAGERSG